MAPTKVLEAFVKLFADDAELRKSFGSLPGAARKAGDAAGLSFSEGLNRSITQQAVTPGRATGARPLQLPRVGGREVDLSSPFSRGFQQFKTARELANIGPGGIVPGGGAGGGGGRGGAGRGLLGGGGGLGGGLGRIGRAAGFGGIGARIGLLANPATAIPAVVIGSLALYVKGIEAATQAERKLMRAREAGDVGAVTGIFQEAGEAVRDYEANLIDATATSPDFATQTRGAIATVKLAWAELSGRGLGQLQKEAEASRQAATRMWEAFGRPKLAITGIKRASDELARTAELALKAAGDWGTYNAAIDKLVQSKQRAAAADEETIRLEKIQIDLDKTSGKITEAERIDKVADAEERLGGVRRKLAQDLGQVEQDRRRGIADMDALEQEHTASIEQQQRQRRDAIVGALGRVIEAEAEANGSLQRLFRARAANQAEDTRTAITNLEAETAARRRALELRIGGAQGDERVKLERELSRVTEEETTKRTQLEVKATEDRIRLVRQTQQALLAQTEQIFSIQRTLGQRSLQDDLSRFSTTAAAAQAGSKTQLDALAKVAAQVKALSDQAKAFLGEALSASDRLAQAEGRDPSELVSLAGLAQDAAAEQRRLEEAQRTLEFGGQISRADFQALQGGGLERLTAGQAAGRSVTAADLARMSVDQGQSFGDFAAGLGGARNLARPETSFRSQLGEAFTEPEDLFRRATGGMSDALDDLVKSADSDFQELEAIVDRSMTVIEQRVQRTGSTLRTSLKEAIKTDIARELDRDLKLY